MNYKLAKKLKEVGFPQNESGDGMCPEWPDVITVGKDSEDWCYLPGLSELIEAGGDEFDELVHFKAEPRWVASKDIYVKGNGKTPEEAVAKLWLEINK